MKAQEIINEIITIAPYEFSGGKDFVAYHAPNAKNLKPLPGNSGLLYRAQEDNATTTIAIYSPNNKQPVGVLNLSRNNELPFKKSFQVGTIAVDPDFGGQGIAKSLYGIALTKLGCTLVAGDAQTPGGRANWVSLSKIPGVEVMGYMVIDDIYFNHDKDDIRGAQKVDRLQDQIMTLGGEYLGQSPGNSSFGRIGSRYNPLNRVFAFPVTVNLKRLETAIKGTKVKVYRNTDWSDHPWNTGLYARWTGA